MSIAGIAASSSHQAVSAQALQSSAGHQRGGEAKSISDVDAQGSSVASPKTSTGPAGRHVNVLA